MRFVVGFLTAVLALSGGTSAQAAAPCPKGATCGSITVPLDHSGATPGTLPLAYARVPATGTRTGTIVLLSGGPGQPAIPLTKFFTAILAPVRASHELVFVDQRGTGRSGAVDCDPMEEGVGLCATRLGSRRAFFTTHETVNDIEDLRVALRIDKLTLLAISYGATVAGTYARRYPDRTAAVLLDSPAPIDGLDALNLLTFQSLDRVMGNVCTGRCRRTVGDPATALARAAARLQRGSLRGRFVSTAGRTSPIEIDEGLLLYTLQTADYQPILRYRLPAALASLAHGDAAPFVHAVTMWPPDENQTTQLNATRLLATLCLESPMPWSPDAPLAGRAASMRAHLATLGSRPFAPFSTRTGYSQSVAAPCEMWPPTPRPAAVPAAGPDVPVLVLSGRDDLRTPLEDARRIAAQYPHATVIEVGGVGHSVLRNEPRNCAARAARAWLRSRDVNNCVAESPIFAAAEYTPASIDALPAGVVGGRPGRTLEAVSVTLAASLSDAEAFRWWYTERKREQIPSQRSGYVAITPTHLGLHAAEWIRGVYVTGIIDTKGRGTVTVSGPQAAPGTLTFTRERVTGTLGGRRISARSQIKND